ncbi:hypothetical protein IW261DRAFT_1609630, partial [Armillaria novae-zelandiae]
MSLLQWLSNALRRVFCGHAGGRSLLKAILLLWRFFQRFFQRFSRTRDDGAPDKQPRRLSDQVLYLSRGVELPTKCTMSLAVNEPVTAVVYRSALPNNPRSSHDISPMSAASLSRTGLAFETDLNPPDGLSPLNDISSTTYNSATDPHLNSADVRTKLASGQGGLSSSSEAAAVPQPLTTGQCDVQNQDDIPNLHDVYPHIYPTTPLDIEFFFQDRPRKPFNPDHNLIAPLTTAFFLHDVPHGWSMHIHPRGPRYYVHESHASATTSSMPSMSYFSLPLQVITDA